MMSKTRHELQTAQKTLRAHLERLFGPELHGVSGFGAGLDLATRDVMLKVTVDGPASRRRAASLPHEIDSLPVRIVQGGPARAE